MKKANFTCFLNGRTGFNSFLGLCFLFFVGLAGSPAAFAQTCGDQFFDTGGADATYSANETDVTTTICPDIVTDVLIVQFTDFNVESGGGQAGDMCWDDLQIITGTDAMGAGGTALVGQDLTSGGFCGADVSFLPNGGIITSGTPGDCATFIFNSDASGQLNGWEANVLCQPLSTCSLTAVTGTASACGVPQGNAFQLDVEVTYTDAPATGTLDVTVDGVTVNAPITGSPQTVTFELPSLEQALIADVSFSDDILCSLNGTDLGTAPVPCSIVTDVNGPGADYPVNANETVTVCPDPGTILVLNFLVFDLEDSFAGCFDELQIILGTDAGGMGGTPLAGGTGANGGFCENDLGETTGNLSVLPNNGQGITSGVVDECITLILTSDGSVTGEGYVAEVVSTPPPPCMITDLSVDNVTACGVASGNNYQVTLTATYQDEPAAGTLDVTVDGQTFNLPITGSPQTETFELSSDGASTDISASFSDTPLCAISVADAYTAPAQCSDCGTVATDPGGIAGNYTSGTTTTSTYCPDSADDAVVLTFNEFEVEDGSADGCWDDLQIIIGTDAAGNGGTQVPGGQDGTSGGFCGNDTGALPNGGVIAGEAGTCITLILTTDASVAQAGFAADVDCFLAPQITNDPGTFPGIADPCTCNNDATPFANNGTPSADGTFSEEIELFNLALGDVYNVTAFAGGLNNVAVQAGDTYTDNGVPGLSVGDSFADTNNDGEIRISGDHVDGVGYSITLSNGLFVLTQANTCFYPIPSIAIPSTTFCTNSPAIPLAATEANGGVGNAAFTLGGVAVNEIDPAALGAGTYNLVLSFDAGTAASNDNTDPGCVQAVTETITIQTAPTSITCNDNVQISLDDNCSAVLTPDMILEGADGCESSYTVNAYNGLGVNLGNVLDNSFVGNTYTVRVTEILTGNYCWGSITVEDKLDPVLACPAPVTIPCTADTAPGSTFPLNFFPTVLPDNTNAQIPFEVPAGVTVADVNFMVNIELIQGALFNGNVTVDLTSPSGTTVNAIITLFGAACEPGPLWVNFDDEGAVTLACPDFTTGINHEIPFGWGLLSDFDGEDAEGTWLISVAETNGGGDVISLVDANIDINGIVYNPTAISGVQFPNGLVLGTNVFPVPGQPRTYTAAAGTIDNCSPVTLSYIDDEDDNDCASGLVQTIIRFWTAVDASGNEDNCTQVIFIERPTLADVTFPEDITWQCDQDIENAQGRDITAATPLHPTIVDADPVAPSINVGNGINGLPSPSAGVLNVTGSGVATINGLPVANGDICGITCQSVDSAPIEVCPGTTKILRTWTCIDWCAGEEEISTQIVKVVDEIGPDVTAPTQPGVNPAVPLNFINVYSASAPAAGTHADCKGNPVVPAATGLGDNCSSITSWKTQIYSINPVTGFAADLIAEINTNGGQFLNIPLYNDNGAAAQYIVRWKAFDACGNETVISLTVTMFDKVPPVAVCDEITQVSITNSSVDGNSCSAVFAEDLDDGSYDNCTDVHFLVSRMNNADPTSVQNFYFPARDVCCSDIPGPVNFILLVLDDVAWNTYLNTSYGQLEFPGQPAGPNNQRGIRGTTLDLTNDNGNPLDMDGRYSFCMVQVLVEDKLAPTIVCPPNATINCDDYTDQLAGNLLACTPNGVYTPLSAAVGTEDDCQSTALENANYGTATAFDNCAPIIDVRVTVNLNQCTEGTIIREFIVSDASDNGTVSFPNGYVGNTASTCRQTITVTHVSDWVVEFPADVTEECLGDEPDFGQPEIFFETCELIATSFEDQVFNIVPDACFKITRQWTVINWCVVGDEIDQQVIETPESGLPGLCIPSQRNLNGVNNCNDRTFQDGLNSTNVNYAAPLKGATPDGYITYQQVIKVIDNEAPEIVEPFTVGNVCIITGNNGTNNDFSGCVYNGVLPTPTYSDCIIDVNDEMTGENNGIANAVIVTARVFDAAGNIVSNSVIVNNLAIGSYTVRYTAIDRCGNTTVDVYPFDVDDCKLPTPYCKDGVVLELMAINDPNNTTFVPMVELWASDLDLGSFDNCAGAVKLSFSEDVNDIGRQYTCDNVGQNEVSLYVTDANDNVDFCTTFVIIQANQGQCPVDPGSNPLVAGSISNEQNASVENVTVQMSGQSNGMSMTTVDGNYSFNVPTGSDVTITPSKDDNHDNGVSTFDLVVISKHILGTQTLGSPYKMIAADANNSGTITTLDLVQIRKLILHIDTEFSNNTSWRFINKDFSFTNPNNPWATSFPEVININNIAADQLATDFVAVKIGDVNGSATTNNNLLGADDRSAGKLVIAANDRMVKAGETVTVDFTTVEAVEGYQFTMNFSNALDFVTLNEGTAAEENFGFAMLNERAITASWNGNAAANAAAFSMTFTANADVLLSEALNINSRYTAAEAYNNNNELLNVELNFNADAVSTFELYQNTPNPFNGETTIGFNMAEEGAATLTITDMSGRVLTVIKGNYAKGYNQEVVNNLPATGVMYYTLATANETATKKMVATK